MLLFLLLLLFRFFIVVVLLLLLLVPLVVTRASSSFCPWSCSFVMVVDVIVMFVPFLFPHQASNAMTVDYSKLAG